MSQSTNQNSEVLSLDLDSYFPIRELSVKTGVNSVTLRAWERRYGLLKPKRTDKGHRLYGHDDVLRVEAILRWIQQGVAVSKVRALLDQEGAVFNNVALSSEWVEWQQALLKAANAFQEDKIGHLYQEVFSQYPASIAVKDWLLPALEQLRKGAIFVFCESVLIRCLSTRLTSLKTQNKKSEKVLVLGLSSQRVLWCYMAASIISDKGWPCLVVPNSANIDDWSDLVDGTQVQSVLAFCENEQASKAVEIVEQMSQWKRPVAAIGASFWLSAEAKKHTSLEEVSVFSDPFEGVMEFMNRLPN